MSMCVCFDEQVCVEASLDRTYPVLSNNMTVLNYRLKHVSQDENFGKSFMILHNRGKRGGVRFGRFVFPKANPKTMANQAVSSESHVRAMQRELAPYLERFAHYFSQDFLLERLMMRLIGDQMDGGKDLNIIFSSLLEANMITAHAPAEDTDSESSDEEDGVPSDVRCVIGLAACFMLMNDTFSAFCLRSSVVYVLM